MVSGSIHSHIATLAERSSRCVRLVELANKTPDYVIAALTATFQQLPDQLKQSLTWDRGPESGRHEEFSGDTGIEVSFCDPKSPSQRGTNENTNRLVRQYRPHGMNLKTSPRISSTTSRSASTSDPARPWDL